MGLRETAFSLKHLRTFRTTLDNVAQRGVTSVGWFYRRFTDIRAEERTMPRRNPNQRERGQGARLSKRSLDTLGPGRWSDGPHGRGLMFNVKETGARSWLQRLTVGGRRRTIGLGPYPEVGLDEARDMAIDNNRTRLKGRDPFAERKRARTTPTFAEARDAYIALQAKSWKPGTRNESNWRCSLAHAKALDAMPVDQVTTEAVLAVVTRLINAGKLPTAKSVRQRIRAVLDWAIASGHREGPNPANGEIDAILPKTAHRTKHHDSVPVAEVTKVLAAVEAIDAPTWRGMKGALRLAVLTAARTSEVIGMRWGEVDLEAATWEVPAARMKAKRAHRVALSAPALEVLHEARRRTGGEGLVFRSPRRGQLDDAALRRVMKRAGRSETVHGFRGAFKSWCLEHGVPRELAEMSLAHQYMGDVESSYVHTDLLEKRRPVMERWARHCTETAPAAKVVAIR